MTISHPFEKKRFSYADYLTWGDDQRRELIHGGPVLMPPAPNRSHQTVLKKLGYQIETYMRGKTCELFLAPFPRQNAVFPNIALSKYGQAHPAMSIYPSCH